MSLWLGALPFLIALVLKLLELNLLLLGQSFLRARWLRRTAAARDEHNAQNDNPEGGNESRHRWHGLSIELAPGGPAMAARGMRRHGRLRASLPSREPAAVQVS